MFFCNNIWHVTHIIVVVIITYSSSMFAKTCLTHFVALFLLQADPQQENLPDAAIAHSYDAIIDLSGSQSQTQATGSRILLR